MQQPPELSKRCKLANLAAHYGGYWFEQLIKTECYHAVYVVSLSDGTISKIGRTSRPRGRMKGYRTTYFSQKVQIHGFWWTPGLPVAARIEHEIVLRFKDSCINGREWFSAPPEALIKAVFEAAEKIPVRIFTEEELVRGLAEQDPTMWPVGKYEGETLFT